MTNYQLGKIYKIVCNTTGLTYYGSTCEPTLARRLSGHRDKYKNWVVAKKGCFVSSFEVLKNNNYTIVLVEPAPSINKMELFKRERYYIEINDCVNRNIPSRTIAEWRMDNIELINNWKLNNKEKILKYQAKYRLNNQEKEKARGQKYRENNREKETERQEVYRANNEGKMRERTAIYREKNREKLREEGAVFRLKNREKLREEGSARRLKQKELKSNPPLGEITE
jgi:hypothetical protein